MPRHTRFHLKTLDLLRAELTALGVRLPIDEDLSILGRPVALAGRQIANRFIVQPMEGFDSEPDGAPGPLSFRRYQRFAEGGSALLWFEATAVLDEARSNPRQLCLHKGNVSGYARLVEATRAAARKKAGRELFLVVQLTHSGRYSKPQGVPRPLIAHHSAILDPRHKLPPDYPLVSDEYLDRLQDVYVEAARLAARAGFDAVDIKACHRYLVSELLASFTREGKYGGPLENRSRLLRETMARIRGEVPGLAVATRMNVYDAIAYPYGFGVDRNDWRAPDLREPIELIGQLRQIGIPLINVSIGNPYYNPQYGRPFDRATSGAETPDEHPLLGVARIADIARQVQEAHPDLPVVGSGLSWLRHLMPYVAAGVIRSHWATLIGQGRGAFAYPDSVNDILTEGRMKPEKTCIACSGCTQIMRDGTMTGCVVRDSEIYGEQYKLGRRYALDRLLEEARRCQDCEFPTCVANCPARVDVPGFVRAFAAERFGDAYEVLRQSNVLPEMCASICPAEVQCEGGCLERIFTDHALPIRDIQLMASRIARSQGLTGLRLPPESSGRCVAVVGGGPAGLACAIRLLEKGHRVVILEKGRRLGGTPDSLIPASRFQQSTAEVDAILAPAKAAGRVEIQFGRALGESISVEELLARYDAVYLAVGLSGSTSLGSAAGVCDALTFLRDAKQGKICAMPGRVAVLGGGNTAIDAAVTARKLGASDVFLVYRRSLAEMPVWPSERQRLFDAGCHLLVLAQPAGYRTDSGGKLTGLRIARTELGEPDESGRRRPAVVPDSESVLPVEMVIEAMGQTIPADLRKSLGRIDLDGRGLVATRPGSCVTSLAGVFAGGDLINGGTTAVRGVADGMKAAEEIDRVLNTPG